MQALDFTNIQKLVMKKLEIDDYIKPHIETIHFKNKIAEDDNLDRICSILDSHAGQEVLLTAGTGTGKTYAVNQIINKIITDEETADSDRKSIHILLTPSRAQTMQLENEYGFKPIVGGIDSRSIEKMFLYAGAGKKSLKLSVVYDKAEDICDGLKKYLNYYSDTKIYLYVDEAHKLCTAYGYRDSAIQEVENLIQSMKDFHGVTCLMTATPRSLVFRKEINTVIECTGTEKVTQYAKLEIICKSNQSDKIEDMVYSTIVKEHESGNRCFVRYNSFADTGNVSSKLRALKKYDVKVVSSQNKDYDIITDTEGNTYTEYTNPIYNCVINSSSLPKADVWFTTSMLDEGNNISKIQGIGQDENLTAVFVVKDRRHMQIDDLQQFLARIRFPFKKAIVIMNKMEDESEPIKKLENIAWGINKQVRLTKQIIETYAEIMKLQDKDTLTIKNELERFKQIESISGIRSNLDCISIDSHLEIQIDERMKELLIYNAYNNQYADNVEKFYELLEKETDCDSITLNQASIISEEFYPTEILEKAIGNDRLLQQIYNNRLSDDELKMIEHTKVYKQLKDLIRISKIAYGKTANETDVAKRAVMSMCENCYKEEKQALISRIVSRLLPHEIRELTSIYCDMKLSTIQDLFKEEGLIEPINNLTTILGDINIAVDKFKKLEGNLTEINKYIKENYQAYMNEMYLTDRNRLWGLDVEGRAHCLILDELYEVNSKGNMKKKTITDKLLENLVVILNAQFGDKAYTERKVKNRIKKMFVMQDGDKIAYLKKVKR